MGVANNFFEKWCYQIHMFPHTVSDRYLLDFSVLCKAHVVFLLSQHKATPAGANRVSRDRKGNDTNMQTVMLTDMNTDALHHMGAC